MQFEVTQAYDADIDDDDEAKVFFFERGEENAGGRRKDEGMCSSNSSIPLKKNATLLPPFLVGESVCAIIHVIRKSHLECFKTLSYKHQNKQK